MARPVEHPLTADPLAARLPSVLPPADGAVLEDDVEWSGVEVRGDFASLEAQQIEISECRVVGSTLTSVDLHRARLTDSVLVDCELSGATIHEATLIRVEFVQCRMLGFSLPQARLRDVSFVECRLDGAEFRMIDGDRFQFDHCSLVGADFYGARLARVRFFDSDLTDVEFSKAQFEDGRLHGSKLEKLRGAGSFRNVTIDSTQIIPMALQVFGSAGINVDDERDPRWPHRSRRMSVVRIGVLGAARIVPGALIRPARDVPEASVVVIAARDRERANQFASKHGIGKVAANYAAVLEDPDVDAIYNPLPNGLHARWTMAALEAGKHVLCEKPFTANATEAEEVAVVGRAHGSRRDGSLSLPVPPAGCAHAGDRRQRGVGGAAPRGGFLLLSPAEVLRHPLPLRPSRRGDDGRRLLLRPHGPAARW